MYPIVNLLHLYVGCLIKWGLFFLIFSKILYVAAQTNYIFRSLSGIITAIGLVCSSSLRKLHEMVLRCQNKSADFPGLVNYYSVKFSCFLNFENLCATLLSFFKKINISYKFFSAIMYLK